MEGPISRLISQPIKTLINEKSSYDETIDTDETIILPVSPTAAPTVENIDAADETHQFDADAALLLNITLICCTMLVR
jgi:hypothetical protein